jgi:carbohydrate diacid regulator
MPARIQTHLAQQIVDTLKTICSHDINFIDPDGRISASTDPARVGGYHSGGYEAARAGKLVTIEADDPERNLRQGINMPIRFHGDTVAVIGITGVPEAVQRYADLAQRLTLLLLREHEIDARNYGTRTQTGYLVRALIDREPVAPDFISEVLKRNGLPDSGELWRTVVIRLQEAHESPLSTIEAAIQGAVTGVGKCLYAYRYPNEYVLLIREREVTLWERVMSDLAAGWPGDLRVGIGSTRRLSRQDLSFQAARLALQSLEAGENIAFYEKIRLELLLGSVSDADANAFIQKCLGGLNEQDRVLLGAYFASEMSLKDTALRCFMHINTLQYRLKRIRDHCGLDPRRFRDAATLYMALRLEAQKRV